MQFTNYRNNTNKKLPMQPMVYNKSGTTNNKYILKYKGVIYNDYEIRKLSNDIQKIKNGASQYIFDPFFDKNIVELAVRYGTYFSVNILGILSMYAKESGYGRACHCYDNSNFFNIKKSSGDWAISPYLYLLTDNETSETNWYYGYDTKEVNIEASMWDYCLLITKSGGYPNGVDYFETPSNNMTSKSSRARTYDYISYLRKCGYFEADLEPYKDIIDFVATRINQLYN